MVCPSHILSELEHAGLENTLPGGEERSCAHIHSPAMVVSFLGPNKVVLVNLFTSG